MTLLDQPGHPFDYYVRALRGLYGDLTSLVDATNKQVFMMRRQPTPMFMNVPHNKLQVGKFYLVNYNFSSSKSSLKLYCPIFVIDYRITEVGKHVIYAINLDYLPFDYKVLYFNRLNVVAKSIFDFNSDAPNFMQEQPIPINFEQIYNTLKSNGGYNYAISAFDITKIIELYGVSTSLMYLMIHIHMRPINVALMKEKMEEYEQGTEKREKLEKLTKELTEMHQTYEEDVQDYYKKLRNLENNYKLLKD